MNHHQSHLQPLSRPEHFDHMRSLYYEAFPEDERRPWEDLVAKIADGTINAYGVFAHGNMNVPVGFITLWHLEDFAYIEHFAIDSSMRGRGLGALVLDELAAIAPAIVLEVELPDSSEPMTLRRIEFYSRCGFTLLDYDYTQPPYAPGLNDLPMRLMSRGCTTAPECIEQCLHHHIYQKR